MRSKSLDLVEQVGSDEAALFDCPYRDQQEPEDYPIFRKYTRRVWTSRRVAALAPMQMRACVGREAVVRHFCIMSLIISWRYFL